MKNYCRKAREKYVCDAWAASDPFMRTCDYYEQSQKKVPCFCKWVDTVDDGYFCKNEEAHLELQIELL